LKAIHTQVGNANVILVQQKTVMKWISVWISTLCSL